MHTIINKHDVKHTLRLSLLYKILGLTCAVFSFLIGMGMVLGPMQYHENDPQGAVNVLIAVSILNVIGGLFFSVVLLLVSSFLKNDKCHLFCKTIAWLLCFCFPIGTMLGIYTLQYFREETVFVNDA